MAFSRANMVSPPAEKYKYLLELQMNQNEARRRMEDRIKRETPSALRAIMGESSTTNQTPIQAGSASTSASTLPQRAFAPTQGQPLHRQTGLVGSDVQVKVEPSEPPASIGATVKPSSASLPALNSTTTPILPSAQSPTVPTTTTLKPTPYSAFTPVTSFSTGVAAAPAIPFSTFFPTSTRTKSNINLSATFDFLRYCCNTPHGYHPVDSIITSNYTLTASFA
ncbi:hypothetical protein BG000_001800 [Podila horticola]|nr:hypothetical protein BG000_001800 [Podila horticola]